MSRVTRQSSCKMVGTRTSAASGTNARPSWKGWDCYEMSCLPRREGTRSRHWCPRPARSFHRSMGRMPRMQRNRNSIANRTNARSSCNGNRQHSDPNSFRHLGRPYLFTLLYGRICFQERSFDLSVSGGFVPRIETGSALPTQFLRNAPTVGTDYNP
jgi:NADH:ubiquinone oxidoreductase subunit